MFNWFNEIIFNIKFWFKIRKLKKLDPFVYDFDTAMLRNPNGNNGQLMATTTTTASTNISCIGHYIQASQCPRYQKWLQ